MKTTKRRDWNKGLDADNTRKVAANDERVNERKDKVKNECAAAAAAGLQTVDKDGKDTKLFEASAAIKKNFDSQKTGTNAINTPHRRFELFGFRYQW